MLTIPPKTFDEKFISRTGYPETFWFALSNALEYMENRRLVLQEHAQRRKIRPDASEHRFAKSHSPSFAGPVPKHHSDEVLDDLACFCSQGADFNRSLAKNEPWIPGCLLFPQS
ncbi:unnamed protein product [Durusdinium trenchii]|uniref:Uncharacterized protein n=1 Tax=Durusdinium trenchii TaxID=1381693 RepID=A0ABP0KJR7_9DINO